MNQYNVTLQAVVNVRVPGIHAATVQEAADAALTKIDLYGLFDRQKPTQTVEFTAYAEEVREALVDEIGDNQHDRSIWLICRDGQWIPNPANCAERPASINHEGPPTPPKNENSDVPAVIVSVNGGVADIIYKPLGLDVTIIDYDVTGEDEGSSGLERDADGELCTISCWPGSLQVVQNEHWPMVKRAMAVAHEPKHPNKGEP